ncbi:hypothetical protein P171DRAFT_477237 [Karstenula rhodostoma CBS 690.94]|uniref:Extracellular membrane protein CFEM domain-containing protein n=1 Tax=Karstenula rhodostoma CBS 690.94 TaxID=1392251 RepID=A0A9P4P6T8_9PLEO|nr:hypothetical protein P171DRAFT_477237 [Karstenula rhodostoma CBS 690.94]
MMFPILSLLQVLLCSLVVFVSLGNATNPLPAPRPVAVATSFVPDASKLIPIPLKAVAPNRRGSGGGSKGGGSGGGRGGGGRNSKGGSRSGRKTLPRLRPLPREEDEITAEDDASVFSLRSSEDEEGDEQVLFESFDEPNLAFYSKMYDFFAVKENYLPTGAENPYAEATDTPQDPFPSNGWRDRPTGKPIRITRTASSPTEHEVTATFRPTEATDACKAWSTLRSFCGNAGQDCACYSGTYYVPDQWNSLADACASVASKCSGTDEHDDVWCRFGSTAYDYNTYCPDLPRDESVTSAKFAEIANLPEDSGGEPMETPNSTPDEPTTRDDLGSTPEEETTTSDEPVVLETSSPSSTPATNPAQTTTESSIVLIFSTGFPSDFPACLPSCGATSAPTGSWSSRSLDPILASTFAWLSLLTAMLFL